MSILQNLTVKVLQTLGIIIALLVGAPFALVAFSLGMFYVYNGLTLGYLSIWWDLPIDTVSKITLGGAITIILAVLFILFAMIWSVLEEPDNE